MLIIWKRSLGFGGAFSVAIKRRLERAGMVKALSRELSHTPSTRRILGASE
jgi:hypothetical protein